MVACFILRFYVLTNTQIEVIYLVGEIVQKFAYLWASSFEKNYLGIFYIFESIKVAR